MRRPVLPTLAAVFVALTPGAAAGGCISDAVLTFGVGTTRFDVEQIFNGGEAEDLREAVDTGAGNGDGRVTAAEVARWEDAMSERARVSIRHCLSTGFFGPEDGGVGAGQSGTLPGEREDFVATFDARGDSSLTGPVTLRFTGVLHTPVEGDRVAVVVVPEALEGLSELIECLAPDAVETNYAQNPCGDQSSDPVDRMLRLVIRPDADHAIDPASILPQEARAAFDGTDIVLANVVIEDSPLAEIRFVLQRAPDPGGGAWLTAALVVGGVGAASAVAIGRIERVRYRFWSALAAAGFTRIRRDRVLEHERRELILGAITAEPGVHLGALARDLDLATGTLVHHLRILQQAGLVQVRRQGNRVHFVPAGHRGPLPAVRSDLQKRILAMLGANPGLSQSDLALKLEEPRNTVAYHVRRLAEDGQVHVRRDGRTARHYLAEPSPKSR